MGDKITVLDDLNDDVNKRKDLFAQNVYRHWVERQNQVRCRLLNECLSVDEMTRLYNLIKGGLTDDLGLNPPKLSRHQLCMAEGDRWCYAGERAFGCSYNGRDQEMGKIYCADRKEFLASARRISTRGGGSCGIHIVEATCYSYDHQPIFPSGPP